MSILNLIKEEVFNLNANNNISHPDGFNYEINCSKSFDKLLQLELQEQLKSSVVVRIGVPANPVFTKITLPYIGTLTIIVNQETGFTLKQTK